MARPISAPYSSWSWRSDSGDPSKPDRFASTTTGRLPLAALRARATFYNVVLVAHILCAIIGFGSVYLNALYGNEIRKRRGLEGIAVYEANFKVSHVGQYFIYGVFVLGIGLV